MAERSAFCGADRRHGAGPCKAPAGRGTDHRGYGRCSWHGGCAPNAVKAAARQRAEAEARQELAKLNVRPVGNPLLTLRRLAGQAEAWKETCARLVNRLTDDSVRYEGRLHGEMVRAEVGMWQDSMRQSASIVTALAKLDIDDRLAAVEQQKADMLSVAFAAALARAQLPAELESGVRAEFASRLRVLQDEDDDGEALTGVVIPPARDLP